MTIESINTVNTTRIQDGQLAGSITPLDVRVLGDSLAGVAVQTAKTADYTVALTDRGTLIPMNSASAHTFFINTDANVNFDIGTVLYFGRQGAGTVAITATTPGTTTITPAGGRLATIRAQGCLVFALKMAANLWWLGWDLSSALPTTTSYQDDPAAAAGGVQIGDEYRNGNFVMVRVS